jgi:pimeloyl-ACP methyl ester carboxylesterase
MLLLGHTDDGDGIPVVLLHAFPLHAGMWQPQIDGLARHTRIITVDAPGRGRSLALPQSVDLSERADQLGLLLDHLGIEKAVLVGLSMGGYTAFAFCRRHPGRLKGLVLADTRAQADSDEARAGRMAMIQSAEKDGVDAVADAMLPKLLGRTTTMSKPDLVRQVREWIRTIPVPVIVSDLRAMAARPDSSALLPSITVPTLVIVGEEDVPTPPAEARDMAGRIGGAEVAVIPQAGHLSNLEQPDRFNEVLKDYLDELGEAG